MTEASGMPPEQQLFQLMFGFMATRALSAVAELKVADALKDGPLYYTDLAQAVGADQRALHRTMRLLVSMGVFAEPKPGTFALTPVSQLLRSDVPGSLRAMAEMITAESHWRPWGQFTEVLRSGRSGAQHAFGTDAFSWFQQAENAAEWELFNAAMTSFSGMTSRAIAKSYDFSGFGCIVDVGGGHGALLRTVLGKAPKATGILVDLPQVVEGVTDTLGGRIECAGKDFFQQVPAGGNCYMMKHIIHDWSDEHCQRLLGNIATVMKPTGKILVFEMVMPETPEPHPAKFGDLNMLAMTEGGCERTENEFAELFASSGLRLTRVIATQSPVSIVEGKKA